MNEDKIVTGERGTPDGKPASRTGKRNHLSGKKNESCFALALATGMSVPQAAKQAKISTTQAYIRINDPIFREEIERQRKAILGQAIDKLVAASCSAVDALTDNLKDESPDVRNRAAATILQNMIHGIQLTEILKRLEALEQQR